MQYNGKRQEKRNTVIKKQVEVFKGKDKHYNIQIMQILLNESELTYVDITKKILLQDPKWVSDTKQQQYWDIKHTEPTIYRRCKALTEYEVISETGDPKRYSLTYKGYIVLGLYSSEFKAKVQNNPRFNNYSPSQRKIENVTLDEEIYLTPKENAQISKLFGYLIPYLSDFFWELVENGILSGRININVIRDIDLHSWLTDEFMSYALMPRKSQTLHLRPLSKKTIKQIQKDPEARKAIEGLKDLRRKQYRRMSEIS